VGSGSLGESVYITLLTVHIASGNGFMGIWRCHGILSFPVIIAGAKSFAFFAKQSIDCVLESIPKVAVEVPGREQKEIKIELLSS